MGLFLILAPFVTFETLLMVTTAPVSLAAGGLVAFGLVCRNMIAGRPVKVLEASALVLFAALAAYHLLATAEPTAIRLAVDGAVLAIALVSLAVRRPFTLQYARDVVDARFHDQPRFIRTNYILTWVWSAAFVLMLAVDIASIYLPGMPLWVWAAIAFTARNSATYFTQWYPKHVRAAVTASPLTAAA